MRAEDTTLGYYVDKSGLDDWHHSAVDTSIAGKMDRGDSPEVASREKNVSVSLFPHPW